MLLGGKFQLYNKKYINYVHHVRSIIIHASDYIHCSFNLLNYVFFVLYFRGMHCLEMLCVFF